MSSVFKVPQKVHHAVLLVARLAEAYPDGRSVPLAEVAERENVSQGFLEEIAGKLRTEGVIAGTRGARGGYVLLHDPREVTVADVVEAVAGPVALTDCLASGGCPMSGGCSSEDLWTGVQRKLQKTLADITIASLARKRARV